MEERNEDRWEERSKKGKRKEELEDENKRKVEIRRW
jgi:hypothetical protein